MASIHRRNDERACTCGTRYGLDGNNNDNGSSSCSNPHGDKSEQLFGKGVDTTSASAPLDASFVHLPPSLLVTQEENRSLSLGMQARTNSGPMHSSSSTAIFDQYKLIALLEKAANDPLNPPPLCMECVQRVERAIQVDTERIESESRVYRERIREENSRIKSWKRALRAVHAVGRVVDDNDITGSLDEADRATQSFQAEIEGLGEVCRYHEEELLHLQSARKELSNVARDLDEAEEMFCQERNSLALEAQAFNNDQEQLYRILTEIQGESERLSSSSIRLPSLLLDLQVDKERGLRYPLINDLRLAYRTKGDVHWDEIQAAWSLAAQLLLYVGTLFHFQSKHWLLVPLSSCAKLIFYPPRDGSDKEGNSNRSKGAIVYNLGHPKTHSSRALLAWNALLHQLASCVLGKMNQACDEGMMESEKVPRLPYEMTSTKIGTIVLTELDENDDAGWSRAIHCMSSNLLWLSDCSSVFVLHQILLQCQV